MDTKVSCNDSSKAQCATFQSLFTYTYTYAYTYSHIHFRAMGGQVLFQDALAARLELIKPSKVDLQNCLTQHPIRLTNGIDRVVQLLHARGVAVYLVSGGFRQVSTC